MAQQNETFFTSVGCMDGRVQEVVAAFGRKRFNAQYPDTITEAGIVGLLAKETMDQKLLNDLIFKVKEISVGMHHSQGVIVHGHAECAGNPVSDERQKEDIRRSITVISQLVKTVPVIGVFVYRDEADQWAVEEVV